MKAKLIYLLLLYFIGTIQFCISQTFTTKNKKSKVNFEKALNYYNIGKYQEAKYYANVSLKHDTSFIEAYLLLADIYNEEGNNAKLIEVLEKIVEINPSFNNKIYFNLGKAYIDKGEYQKAIKNFHIYIKNEENDSLSLSEAKKLIKQCEFADSCIKNPLPIEIKEFYYVNTTNNEYWPSITIDGKEFFFTRLLPTDMFDILGRRIYQEDIYVAKKDEEGRYKQVEPLYEINSPDNEGAVHITGNGKYLYYVLCDKKSEVKHGFGSCDIYVSERVGNRWVKGKNLGPPVNTNYWESTPALSADGRILIFSSDRKPNKGGKDLFISYLQNDGKWSEPINLGDSINTSGNEIAPFLYPDGKTLFFSSDGWQTIGKLDIFVSYLKDDSTWSTPKNLGFPINTPLDDFGLIIANDGLTAYIASDRKHKNNWDIYTFNLPPNISLEPVNYLKGKIIDKKSKKPLSASIEIYDVNKNSLVYKSISDPINGNYVAILPFGSEYMLNVNLEGYMFYSENFIINNSSYLKPYELNVELQPIEVGASIILKNIFFDFDKHNLLPQSEVELLKIVEFLKKNKNLKVEISGHTDNVGTYEYNLQLSEKRAKAVYDYLVENGIEPSRLTYKGYGYTKPLINSDLEEHRKLNRRTEILILKD